MKVKLPWVEGEANVSYWAINGISLADGGIIPIPPRVGRYVYRTKSVNNFGRYRRYIVGIKNISMKKYHIVTISTILVYWIFSISIAILYQISSALY